VASPRPPGVAEGIFLHLMTQSFAVRALLGSLAAAGLVSLAVRGGLIRSSQARRLLVLAPVLTAAGAAFASVGESFLPQLTIATSRATPADRLLDVVGVAVSQRELSVLFVVYALVTALLLARRLLGIVAARRLLAQSTPAAEPRLAAIVADLAARMRIRAPRLVLLASCPGGAFTIGTRRPVVAVDPMLLDALDDRELEGLIAHELAHIRRRDTLLGLTVGVVRDLAFFLPPLHLAARWLRSEQEESADDLAATHTHRPVALASSILKVWDCSQGSPVPRVACAATGPLRLAPVDAPLLERNHPANLRLARSASETTKALAARVERLIGAEPVLSPLRCRAEVALAASVLLLAMSAAVVVPSYLAVDRQVDGLSFGYLLPPSDGPVESPAFATFRALTPRSSVASQGGHRAVRPPVTAYDLTAGIGVPMPCPCVETPAQLSQRIGASEPARVHSWAADGYAPYEYRRTDVAARELWTLSDSGPQVGVFLVTRPR
jgi:beta-lactamase regulating signal transducer with metallopeptidase domain